MSERRDWCVLFLRSPSPGKVFRFLQRRFGKSEEERAHLDALGLLLSDALPPEGWRALAGRDALSWMEEQGPAFAPAFPSSVILLFSDETAAAWGFRLWSDDARTECGGARLRKRQGVLSRFLRGCRWSAGRAASESAVAWAVGRDLPIGRVPALAGRRPPPVYDYRTVAGLDARGLLIEDRPRLYRFSFVDEGESARYNEERGRRKKCE